MEAKRVHFMGVGGAGVSAVAAFAKNAGYQISGCDIDSNSQFLKPLTKLGLAFEAKHDPHHLESVDILVVSPAIESLNQNNPELTLAKERKIPIFISEEFFAKYLIGDKKIIAVTGTHGKSTTTAMISKILIDAALDPSCFVGAVVPEWGSNFRIGNGEYFVIEADEYKEKFLLYQPFISVIITVEMDHPEYFPNFEKVKEAFVKFAKNTNEDGFVVLGKDIEPLEIDRPVLKFGQDYKGEKFNLKIIGDFNQVTASIAFQVAKLLKIDEQIARTALERFGGIGRRLEFKGEEKGVKVFDDYGHHPTAIRTIIEATKNYFPNEKIWLVYQPHMYSRTKYLFDEFVEVFRKLPIHETVLVDIFAARQENKEQITSLDIVKVVNKPNVKYVGNFENTTYYLAKNVGFGDIVVVMGAGDVYKLSQLLLDKLANKG